MQRKIRVLIVDDSLLAREILLRGLSTDSDIEVVATAGDPFEARDKIMEYRPDVMTCDVEMPKMNGLEFIRKLIPQYPMPVIVVSSLSGKVFDVLNAGAIDFVAKPNMSRVQEIEEFLFDLIHKIKAASQAKIQYPHLDSVIHRKEVDQKDIYEKIIAIGASTGGTEAIHQILKNLSPKTPGIVIVQHIPPNFSRMFAERMDSTCSLHVKEASTGDYVEPGHVYIAPGDQHMIVKRLGDRYKIDCYQGEKVNGHCPSVDILFESVAKAAGSLAIGVILTGMGYDGAKGLMAMKRKGAKTIGQDESSSVVYGMPKVAKQIGAVDQELPLHKISDGIYSILSKE